MQEKPQANTLYPNKQEILQNIKIPNEKTKSIIIKWKKQGYYKKWRNSDSITKIKAFKYLTKSLVSSDTKILFIETSEWFTQWHPDDLCNKAIGIDTNNLSIISCLHEIGHIIFGSSELDACTYSVGIFSTCFPIECNTLEWKGHMLTRKT